MKPDIQIHIVLEPYKQMLKYNNFSKNFLRNNLKSIIVENENGFAGFKKLEYLVDYLWHKNFTTGFDIGDLEATLKFLEKNIFESKIKKILEKAAKFLSSDKPLSIFIFPLLENKNNEFCFTKLSGIDAYTVWQNTILISIGKTKTKNWRNVLEETIIHEYCHAIAMNFLKLAKFTLADYLVFEGLADAFVKRVLNRHPIWLKNLTNGKEHILLKELENKFRSTDWNFNKKVMFGGDDFPLWAGYWIGFKIVNFFLAKNPETSFNEIIRLPLSKIFEEGFDTYFKSLNKAKNDSETF